MVKQASRRRTAQQEGSDQTAKALQDIRSSAADGRLPTDENGLG